MYRILEGLTVVEAASFVAAPSAGLYLAQMGAHVIRVDQIGGGPDFRRWPLAASGHSLYWEGLNKGKASVALDLGTAEGRDLMVRLATAPSTDLFLTNFPADGFLSHDRLKLHRADLLTIRIMGQADGGPALDYTVNAALGLPGMTGAAIRDGPINHVLPAWDLLTGAYAAFAALVALHHRKLTGEGLEVRIALADIGISTLANLGMLAESIEAGADRAPIGNDVYGAFGRDFETADGERLMVVAITPRQWSGLVAALGIGDAVAAIELQLGVSFAHDEGLRFRHRDLLNPLVAQAIRQERLAVLASRFAAAGVCFGRYGTLVEAAQNPALVCANPIFAEVEQPSGRRYPLPGAAAIVPGLVRERPSPAARLGADSKGILSSQLGLHAREIADLAARSIIA